MKRASWALLGAGLAALGCLDLKGSPASRGEPVHGTAGAAPVSSSSAAPTSGAAGAGPREAAGAPSVAPTPSGGNAGANGTAGSGSATKPEGGASGAGGGGGAGPEPVTSICLTKTGAAIPYDYSRGLAGEYAFELAMSCELGGYVLPLVEQDPEMLTGVDAFAATLTDWLRHDVLVCVDASPPDASAVFLLLPAGAAGQVSRGDFRSAIQLFLRVLDRHDALEDGFAPATKQELRRRLDALAPTAVKHATDTLSHPSPDPACLPAQAGGGEGGASSE